MGKKSRTKGAAGEREAIRLLTGLLGEEFDLSRNLSQYQSAGLCDVKGIDGFSIEVKRHKTITDSMVKQFWKETVNQAYLLGTIPVLMYRADRCEWRIVTTSFMTDDKSAVENYLYTFTISPELFALQVKSYRELVAEFEGAGEELH